MSEEAKLAAAMREGTGKGAARRLRRQGRVPGVVYSGGKEAQPISVAPNELVKVLSGPFRRNALIALEIAGQGTRHVMVRELQKDPVRRSPVHVDFVEVDLSKPIVVKVPFVTTGRSKAVMAGGKMQVPLRWLRVRCLPKAIPQQIELDTTPLDFGIYRIRDITPPEGVKLVDDPMLTVITIGRPRGAAATAEEGAEAASAA